MGAHCLYDLTGTVNGSGGAAVLFGCEAGENATGQTHLADGGISAGATRATTEEESR